MSKTGRIRTVSGITVALPLEEWQRKMWFRSFGPTGFLEWRGERCGTDRTKRPAVNPWRHAYVRAKHFRHAFEQVRFSMPAVATSRTKWPGWKRHEDWGDLVEPGPMRDPDDRVVHALDVYDAYWWAAKHADWGCA